MKKSSIKNFSKSLISASLRGLAAFVVFGFALYAYAVTYPATQPNSVSGVVGLYVGKTVGTQDGNIGNYQTANNLCNAVEADSHICTPMEIVNTYNHNPPAVTGETGTVWINSGAPANTFPAVNDCNGWKNNSLSFYGNVWSFDANDFSGILPCAFNLAIACCK
jgi:hypothetical protein